MKTTIMPKSRGGDDKKEVDEEEGDGDKKEVDEEEVDKEEGVEVEEANWLELSVIFLVAS